MPQVCSRIRCGGECAGGVVGYPIKSLYEEVAFLAYHFHWAPEAVLNLEHNERRRWVEEISAINQRINGDG